MSKAADKVAALVWANEPTPRFAGGSPLVLGYEKGIIEVKEAVIKRLAYGGGGVTELKKDVRSMLSRSLGHGLQGRGLADGVRDASLSAAKRLPELRETVKSALHVPRQKRPGRKMVVKTDPKTLKTKLSDYQKKVIVKLYRDGMSLKNIGKRFDRSPAAVTRYLKSINVKPRRVYGKG